MGFADFLFGTDTTMGQLDTRTAEQRGVSEGLGKYFEARIGRGMQRYPGQFVAGMSGFERGGLASLRQLGASGMPDIFNTGTAALTELLAGEPSTEVNPELTEKYFSEGIYDPMFRSMKEDIIPEIEGAYAGNYWGTPRAEATTGAWTDFEEGMSGVLSELIYADEQTRIGLEESANDRQLAATGVAGQMAQIEENINMGRINAAMTYGSLPRVLMQAELDANYNEWLRTRPEYSPVVNQALQFMNVPSPYTPIITPGEEGALPGIMGTIESMIGGYFMGPMGAEMGEQSGNMWGGMFSDMFR